jgi:hypothetical protein
VTPDSFSLVHGIWVHVGGFFCLLCAFGWFMKYRKEDDTAASCVATIVLLFVGVLLPIWLHMGEMGRKESARVRELTAGRGYEVVRVHPTANWFNARFGRCEDSFHVDYTFVDDGQAIETVMTEAVEDFPFEDSRKVYLAFPECDPNFDQPPPSP